MKNIYAVLPVLCLFFLCFFYSCSSHTAKSPQQIKPKWILKPSLNEKIGGVGICGPHVKGDHVQREIAQRRAIDEICRQMGVTIKNISQIVSKGTKDKIQTQMQSFTIQTASGKMVTARINEIWKDESDQKLYIWMVVQ